MKKHLLAITTIAYFFLIFTNQVHAAPAISAITDNRTSYANSQIPAFEKYELTFTIAGSSAVNNFFPYAEVVPPGLTPKQGITVNGEFLPPGETDWSKAFMTPAFYYHDFDYAVKEGKDWLHANGSFFWKVRFAPNKVGTWQYRVTGIDAGGSFTSSPASFNVVASSSHGFVRVSRTDSRYFEFEDGTFFPGLGYNMNYRDIDWVSPVTTNQSRFATLKQKGVQLIRMWQSQWSIFGSFWNPWHYNGNIIDYTWLTSRQSYAPQDVSLHVSRNAGANPCVSFGGWETYTPAVKPNTTYRIRVRYKTTDIGAAINTTRPHGLVVKTGGWLDNCGNSGVGEVRSGYITANNDWTVLTGSYTTGTNQNYFPWLYIALENIATGNAYIDYVWVEEDRGNGQYGPNIIPKPWMSHYQYVDQRQSFAFDKMLDLAQQNDVYLKIVGLEKNDVIANITNFDGTVGTNEQNNGNFYGNYGQPTKIYWLQQAWWRYQQARWGYSTNIHSWELINEGDPGNGNLWKLTDEMGKFMKCRVFGVNISTADSERCSPTHPNAHMTTTSFWNAFPTEFWKSTRWPNSDYADVHAYISTSTADLTTKNLMKYDEALYHQWHSQRYAAENIGKPIMRGEAGLDVPEQQSDTLLGLQADTGKVWLHNFIWAGIHPGGMYEEYWWWKEHMTGSNGSVDPNGDYAKYAAFMKNIPLNNGHYQDAFPTVTFTDLRVWGQKDTVNNRAHLWFQNKRHTWKNVVDNANITPISTAITVSGFSPNTTLRIEWWDTYTGTPRAASTSTTNAEGRLTLSVDNLTTDTAVKIGDYAVASPSPSPAPVPGDTNSDGRVNIFDYNNLVSDFGRSATRSDFNRSGIVDIFDYNILVSNFGR